MYPALVRSDKRAETYREKAIHDYKSYNFAENFLFRARSTHKNSFPLYKQLVAAMKNNFDYQIGTD